VEVLEDDEQRLLARFPEQEPLDGVERVLPALRGLQAAPGRVVHGHVEQREKLPTEACVGGVLVLASGTLHAGPPSYGPGRWRESSPPRQKRSRSLPFSFTIRFGRSGG
jgi:hypothetical protein